MTRKVMNISDGRNQFTCIRDTEQEMEYALYEHWTGIGKYGYPVKHRKLIGRFYGMYSMLEVLRERVGANI